MLVEQNLISIDIQLAPILAESQILSLAALGLDSKGAGPQMFSGTLKNETDQTLNNLYFKFRIEAATVGVIAEVEQQAAYPFSLAPQQLVYATNNDIQNEKIPGIEGDIRFDGGITFAGEEFIESLCLNIELHFKEIETELYTALLLDALNTKLRFLLTQKGTTIELGSLIQLKFLKLQEQWQNI